LKSEEIRKLYDEYLKKIEPLEQMEKEGKIKYSEKRKVEENIFAEMMGAVLRRGLVDRKKALIVLKYIIVSNIDGEWSLGDYHLFVLRILLSLSPEDKVLEKLYLHLEEKSMRYADSDYYNEMVYRDEGKEEAEFYANEIKKKLGEDFFNELEKYVWG